MADVDKCADCGKRGATVYKKDKWGQDDLRSAPRCTLCATHSELAVAYKRKYYTQAFKADCQRRDHALTTRAKRNRKGARHCPNCHGYRSADAFLKGAGAFGHCHLCRDMETARARGVGGMSTVFRAGTKKEIIAKVRAMRDEINRVTADGVAIREALRVERNLLDHINQLRKKLDMPRERMLREGVNLTTISKLVTQYEQKLEDFRERTWLKEGDAEYAQKVSEARRVAGTQDGEGQGKHSSLGKAIARKLAEIEGASHE